MFQHLHGTAAVLHGPWQQRQIGAQQQHIGLHLRQLPHGVTAARLHAALQARYTGEAFVEVAPLADAADAQGLNPQALNGSNRLRLSVFANEGTGQVLLAAGSSITLVDSALPRLAVRVDAPPNQLGRYRLYERVGVGGQAAVYRARRFDEPDGKDVAIKRLHPHLLDDPEAVQGFSREARIAYLIDHPVIRRALALCRQPDELFMVMEYVDGVTLTELLRRAAASERCLPLAGVLTVLDRVCDALAYAHDLVDERGASARGSYLIEKLLGKELDAPRALDFRCPPVGAAVPPLDPDVIAAFAQWIDGGAVYRAPRVATP